MHNMLIILGAIAFSSLVFFTGNLHANQVNNETGSHKNYKHRDSAPYKSLASMLKTAQKKASTAKVSGVHKKSKSHSSSFKSTRRVAADKNKRSLKSVSSRKASTSSFSTRHNWGSKKLTHRVSKRAGKATSHNSSYSAKHPSKSKNLQNGLNRKQASTATK